MRNGPAFKKYLLPMIAARSMTQEQFAAELGLSKAAPTGWFKTGKISGDTIQGIARLLGVPIEEVYAALDGKLPTGVREASTEYLAKEDQRVYVSRVLGAKLSAGSGEAVFDFEEVDRSHVFQRDWMQRRHLRAERCKLYEVKGESMSPTIGDGDMVMINMADREVVSGRVYALVAEDGLRVKRLIKRADGVIEMRSDNPLQHIYPPEPILSGNVAIIGRVVWHAGEL
jgi:phage repressor protein C with HTH and peptisase S24 domain